MQFQIFMVFILSSVILTSWANADCSFGETLSWWGSTELVHRESRFVDPTYVYFNKNNQFNVTIDKVKLKFNKDGAASCRLVSGGPSSSSMTILISPTDSSKKNIDVDVIVKGHWNEGAKKQTINPPEIKFVKNG